jgi:putative transposase
MRQLRKLDADGIPYELSVAKLIDKNGCGDYHIIQTIYVDKDIWTEYKRRKRQKRTHNKKIHKLNALDLGCMKTATDGYGKTYNTQIEETERLKKLNRKYRRQLKAAGWDPKKKNRKEIQTSNNMWKTRLKIRREYMKMDNRKEAAAKDLVVEVLDETEVLVIQDENLSGWQRTGHGKKVHHGILGRVKERLVKSPQVHVINQWVPTTKLCTHCGQTWKEIEEKDRQYVCPHCGHDDGERDTHSSKTMMWLYSNMQDTIGLDGAEFTRTVFDERLDQLFGRQTAEGKAPDEPIR